MVAANGLQKACEAICLIVGRDRDRELGERFQVTRISDSRIGRLKITLGRTRTFDLRIRNRVEVYRQFSVACQSPYSVVFQNEDLACRIPASERFTNSFNNTSRVPLGIASPGGSWSPVIAVRLRWDW